jgi:hypothetical protein
LRLPQLQPPTKIRQLRSFIGAVTFYREMWPRTELTGKGEFRWLPEHKQAFTAMKAMVAAEAMLTYPNHNLPFHTSVLHG